MNLGDQNTAFFHTMVKVKNARNLIEWLVDGEGNKVEHIGKKSV